MDYQFDKNLSIEQSVRNIAKEVIFEAIDECRSTKLTHQEIIHSVRKKCKRIRGLLRIVRPKIGTIYKKENMFFRDLARTLSVSRDHHAKIETLTKLSEIYKYKTLSQYFQTIIEKIQLIDDFTNNSVLIKKFENEMINSIPRIEKWKLKSKGFNTIKGGLRKTYRRGKDAMQTAFSVPSVENYHEWRKRAKYHYYHLELLNPIWENIVKPYTDEVHKLSELLGDDHDLCLLEDLIKNESELLLEIKIQRRILKVIQNTKSELRAKIKLLGERIYHENPNQLVNRLEGWWNNWENENLFSIYIMGNEKLLFYTGLTKNLIDSVKDHKSFTNPKSYTSRLKLTKLLHFETFHENKNAAFREKQIKQMTRKEKLSLIKEKNPKLRDLYKKLLTPSINVKS